MYIGQRPIPHSLMRRDELCNQYVQVNYVCNNQEDSQKGSGAQSNFGNHHVYQIPRVTMLHRVRDHLRRFVLHQR